MQVGEKYKGFRWNNKTFRHEPYEYTVRKLPDKIEERTCAVCGDAFTWTSRHPTQMYCSPACSKESIKRSFHEKRAGDDVIWLEHIEALPMRDQFEEMARQLRAINHATAHRVALRLLEIVDQAHRDILDTP